MSFIPPKGRIYRKLKSRQRGASREPGQDVGMATRHRGNSVVCRDRIKWPGYTISPSLYGAHAVQPDSATKKTQSPKFHTLRQGFTHREGLRLWRRFLLFSSLPKREKVHLLGPGREPCELPCDLMVTVMVPLGPMTRTPLRFPIAYLQVYFGARLSRLLLLQQI